MKTQISKRVDRFGMTWHTWTEHCDVCGKIVKPHIVNTWDTSATPDTSKEDVCLECMHFALDHDLTGGKFKVADIKEAMRSENKS